MIFKASLVKFTTLLLLIICLQIDNSQAKALPKKLIIAGDYWCPYNCNPDSDYPGLLVEIMREALHIYSIEIEYKIMPWHEALKKIKDGQVDGIIGISNIKGLGLVTTKLPLEYSTLGIFIRSDTEWVYDGFSSLRGKKIGVIMDYDLDEDMNNFIGMNYTIHPDMFVVEDGQNAVSDCITNLIDGNIDLYVEDINVADYYLEVNDLGRYVKNIGKISKERLPLYVAFNNNIPNIKQYIKFLEEGIASLKSTGEYDYIRGKYKIDKHKEAL